MFSNRAPKIKTKSCKHRKKWLMSKVQSLKSHYEEILTAFKQRLDNIVDPVIDKANRVLSEADEDAFLKEVFEVGIGIEKCSNDLYEINLFCLGDMYSSEDDSEQSDHDGPVSDLKMSSPLVSASSRLEHCQLSFNDVTPVSSSDPCEVVTEKLQHNTMCDENKQPQENHIVAHDEQPDLSSSTEIDLLLLHNIKIGDKIRVLVSDVISPSSFSVQPEEAKDQLVNLQQELNALYSQQWTKQLQFAEKPKPGTICVALFTIDHCWYRAKVLKELSKDKYEVVYIDYGNRHIVTKDSLRVIDPGFGNIPQLSIQCSLFGVEPALNKGEPSTKWSLPATDWFDQQVFGKWFVAQFSHQNSNSHTISRYSAHLFISKESPESGQTSTWSVADNLVCMGYAAFTSSLFGAHSENENDKGDMKERSLMTHSTTPRRSLLKQHADASSDDVKIIPAGWESSHRLAFSRTREALRNRGVKSNHARSNSAELPLRTGASSGQVAHSRRVSMTITPESHQKKHFLLSADTSKKT